MKRILTAALFAILMASTAATAQVMTPADVLKKMPLSKIDQMEKDAVPMIAEQCAKKWGTDYEMQLHCRNDQTEMAKFFYDVIRDIKQMLQKPEKREEAKVFSEIADRCFREVGRRLQHDRVLLQEPGGRLQEASRSKNQAIKGD